MKFLNHYPILLIIMGCSATNLNAQDQWAQLVQENMRTLNSIKDKYSYSSTNIDKVTLQKNEINFLAAQTQYNLDSMYHSLRKGGRIFWGDNTKYSKLLSTASEISDLDSVKNILDFVGSDAKLKYLNAYPVDTTVEVTVKVFKEDTNEELVGYNVFACPSLSVDSSDFIPFNPTTNAVKKIRPGKKRFWIEKDGFTKEIPDWSVYWK